MIVNNWGLKVLSFFIAFLLWFKVVGENVSEINLSLPVELIRVPEGMVITSRVIDAVKVRLNGPRTLLMSLNPQKISIALDLEGIPQGITTFNVLPRLNLPRGIEAVSVSPSQITLEADRKINSVVTIKPRTKGVPAEGFEVAEIKTTPPFITIEGPEKALKQLKEISTELVDVTGLNGSISVPVELVLSDPTMRPVGKTQVKLEATIKEVFAEREFLQVPLNLPGYGWQALPPAVDIKIEGSLRAITRLTTKDVIASVEPFGDQAPPGPVRVVVTAPADANIAEVKPNLVEIEPLPVFGPEPFPGEKIFLPESTNDVDPPSADPGAPAPPPSKIEKEQHNER